MFKFIKIAFFVMIILIITASILSLYKNYLSISINRLNNEMSLDYSNVQNLKAQWNYLKNKNYLQDLIKKYAPNLVEYKLYYSNEASKINNIKNIQP